MTGLTGGVLVRLHLVQGVIVVPVGVGHLDQQVVVPRQAGLGQRLLLLVLELGDHAQVGDAVERDRALAAGIGIVVGHGVSADHAARLIDLAVRIADEVAVLLHFVGHVHEHVFDRVALLERGLFVRRAFGVVDADLAKAAASALVVVRFDLARIDHALAGAQAGHADLFGVVILGAVGLGEGAEQVPVVFGLLGRSGFKVKVMAVGSLDGVLVGLELGERDGGLAAIVGSHTHGVLAQRVTVAVDRAAADRAAAVAVVFDLKILDEGNDHLVARRVLLRVRVVVLAVERGEGHADRAVESEAGQVDRLAVVVAHRLAVLVRLVHADVDGIIAVRAGDGFVVHEDDLHLADGLLDSLITAIALPSHGKAAEVEIVGDLDLVKTAPPLVVDRIDIVDFDKREILIVLCYRRRRGGAVHGNGRNLHDVGPTVVDRDVGIAVQIGLSGRGAVHFEEVDGEGLRVRRADDDLLAVVEHDDQTLFAVEGLKARQQEILAADVHGLVAVVGDQAANLLHVHKAAVAEAHRRHLVHRKARAVLAGDAHGGHQPAQEHLAVALDGVIRSFIVEIHRVRHDVGAEAVGHEGEAEQLAVRYGVVRAHAHGLAVYHMVQGEGSAFDHRAVLQALRQVNGSGQGHGHDVFAALGEHGFVRADVKADVTGLAARVVPGVKGGLLLKAGCFGGFAHVGEAHVHIGRLERHGRGLGVYQNDDH